MKIIYTELTPQNFNEYSLDSFIRTQKVTRCWRKSQNAYVLTPVEYTEDWNISQKRNLAKTILNGLAAGDAAFGAFCNGEVTGFAFLRAELFGNRNRYIDLAEFYVSAPFRRQGIGKRLFISACDKARKYGAEKLYISAHSAEDSIAAYKSYGCTEALEINNFLAEKEPFDLQLEYVL